MAKFTKYLTVEDTKILNRLQPSPNFDRGAADSIDYRAMLAREQDKADAAEHKDWCDAAEANRVAEGRWEDSGYQVASLGLDGIAELDALQRIS